MFQLVPDLAADWNSTGHLWRSWKYTKYTVQFSTVDFGPISDQFYSSTSAIEIASGVMAAVMVESGWDYFTCVLTLRLKKTWSSWAKALRSWARVLWLGEALGGTGKSEGIFQTWLRKAKAKSLVRLGLVHLCAVMLRSNCLRCGYTSCGIRLWKLGPGIELSGSVEFSFPSYFSWSQRCWKHFHQLWCSSIHDIHDTRPCENEGMYSSRTCHLLLEEP